MKRIVCLFLIIVFTFTLTACSKEQAGNTASPTDLTQQVTENGIVITTTYYSVTLPSLWKDQYDISYSSNVHGGYSLRFRDRVSFETQGFGGHIFTLELHPAMSETLLGFYHGGPDRYHGGLYVPDNQLFTLSSFFPTDVQFITERAEIYNKMQDTFQAVLNSVAPVLENSIYYPAGFDTFEQRARLTTHTEKGEDTIGKFMAETDLELEYVGIALDSLTYASHNSYNDYGFHVYLPKDGTKTYYCIPFRKDDGTLQTVCKMTQYPRLETIWNYKEPELIAYDAFLKGLASSDSQSLGYYGMYDLNNDGAQELLISNDTILTVYSYQNKKVAKLDSLDYYTGTFGLYESYEAHPYNGLFTRSTGGGQNHYGILTLEDNKLVHTPLWNENYSSLPNTPPTAQHANDKNLIEASKNATLSFELFSIEKYYRWFPQDENPH